MKKRYNNTFFLQFASRWKIQGPAVSIPDNHSTWPLVRVLAPAQASSTAVKPTET